ncbi:uncharacterized protein LOC123441830 [Hordeum vulgare subsp. vulgare]|uniref:uncharacterized protein LOC123441830 n=1 Tax=Hordeum vulgare subsp. vulgare TaxID=112509 RepID=UPI001D1A3EEE|nr:uncharacterized protein LOC123441830 [Hordeum vulgare subsp. vulgare]
MTCACGGLESRACRPGKGSRGGRMQYASGLGCFFLSPLPYGYRNHPSIPLVGIFPVRGHRWLLRHGHQLLLNIKTARSHGCSRAAASRGRILRLRDAGRRVARCGRWESRGSTTTARLCRPRCGRWEAHGSTTTTRRCRPWCGWASASATRCKQAQRTTGGRADGRRARRDACGERWAASAHASVARRATSVRVGASQGRGLGLAGGDLDLGEAAVLGLAGGGLGLGEAAVLGILLAWRGRVTQAAGRVWPEAVTAWRCRPQHGRARASAARWRGLDAAEVAGIQAGTSGCGGAGACAG